MALLLIMVPGGLAVLCLAIALWCRCGRKSKVTPIEGKTPIEGVKVTPIEGQKIFGSYKQEDDSDALMMNMFHAFKTEGVDFWLDKMRGAERSEAGMVAGVKACDCFCAVISPKYFGSRFCVLEMKTAIQHKKQIAVCFNGSKFKVKEALGWIPEEFAHLRTNELIKLDEDNEFMTVSLEKLRVFVKKPPKLIKAKTAALKFEIKPGTDANENNPGTDAKKAQTEGDLKVMDISQEAVPVEAPAAAVSDDATQAEPEAAARG